MIYTVTFNPAIDYVMEIPEIKSGKTNRSLREEIYYGGKGINVSFILKELGIKSTALGFSGGFTGNELEKGLESQSISTDFVHIKNGITRINVKLQGENVTEVNALGPEISDEEIKAFFKKLDKIESGDTLVLAGSVPSSLPCDIYEKILTYLKGRKIKIIVDAEKDLLLKCLKFSPYLIKPNADELCAIFEKEFKTEDELISGAKELKNLGAQNVLISLGEKGALLLDENGEIHKIGIAKIVALNTVGAGDSMVAGFIAGAIRDYDYALKLGTACGCATCASKGLATKEKINEILQTL